MRQGMEKSPARFDCNRANVGRQNALSFSVFRCFSGAGEKPKAPKITRTHTANICRWPPGTGYLYLHWMNTLGRVHSVAGVWERKRNSLFAGRTFGWLFNGLYRSLLIFCRRSISAHSIAIKSVKLWERSTQTAFDVRLFINTNGSIHDSRIKRFTIYGIESEKFGRCCANTQMFSLHANEAWPRRMKHLNSGSLALTCMLHMTRAETIVLPNEQRNLVTTPHTAFGAVEGGVGYFGLTATCIRVLCILTSLFRINFQPIIKHKFVHQKRPFPIRAADRLIWMRKQYYWYPLVKPPWIAVEVLNVDPSYVNVCWFCAKHNFPIYYFSWKFCLCSMRPTNASSTCVCVCILRWLGRALMCRVVCACGQIVCGREMSSNCARNWMPTIHYRPILVSRKVFASHRPSWVVVHRELQMGIKRYTTRAARMETIKHAR